MVYVFLVFSLLFSSCTNYVTQAEDLRDTADSKVFSLNPDSLENYLSENDLGVVWNFNFNPGVSEGDISTLNYEFAGDEFISPKNFYLWAQNTQDEWTLLDSSKNNTGTFSTNASLSFEILQREFTRFRLSLNNEGSPQFVLGDLNLSKTLIEHLEIIQTKADSNYTSQSLSLYKALANNFKLAITHLQLAQRGSHTTHLKHVHFYLSGHKEANKIWWSEAPISNVDSIGVLLQLQSFAELLSQLKVDPQISLAKKVILQANLDTINAFRNELILFMDSIEDFVLTDAQDVAQDLEDHELLWSQFINGKNDWEGFNNWPQTLIAFLEFDSRL